MIKNSKIEFWRIVRSKYLSDAFSGGGSELAGGRFNSAGRKAVYTSGSLSLAMLELLVQVKNRNALIDMTSLSILVEAKHVEVIKAQNLPTGWKSLPHNPSTKNFGDKWLTEQRSLVLQIPSVLVPRESNFVINPMHPAFGEIEFGITEPIRFDSRRIF